MGILSFLYRTGLFCHKSFHLVLKKPHELPGVVVSAGNITLGGTGKTPAVIALAREAKKRGLMPCILTRGYKGKTKDVCFVSKGDSPLLNSEEAGDEAFLMAATLKGVPIVKGSSRYKAGLFALREVYSKLNNPDSKIFFILDDGFQHWPLKRDMDIVLVDATNPFGNGKVVPEGTLREPVSALNRADIIVLSKSDMVGENSVKEVTHEIRRHNAKAPVYTAAHRPIELMHYSGENFGLSQIKGKKIYAFAGIANTVYFESLLRANGVEIIEFNRFRDHHFYSQKDIDSIKKGALGLDVITTEKDLVKLKDLRLPDNLYALRIEFSIDPKFYQNIFNLMNLTSVLSQK